MLTGFSKCIFSYLKNILLLPNRVRRIQSAVFKISDRLSKISDDLSLQQKNIRDIFSGLNEVDNEKPTLLVCNSHFRMLRYIEPLLNMAQSEGYQIVVLNAPREENDSEQFRTTKYSKSYKIIYLSAWAELFSESTLSMSDYIFSLYALLYNYNIQAILVDELHFPPLSRFGSDFPFIKEVMPPIIAFKHALLFPIYLRINGFRMQAKILNDYCDLHFVWGDLQKSMFPDRHQDKIISAGWNALDHLKNIPTSLTPKVFLAAGATYSKGYVDEVSVIKELLTHTELEIYAKAHPDLKKKKIYPPHARLHVMGDFDDYIPILTSCTFSMSYGSNIFAESLSLKKPHVILPSPYSSDHIFDPLRHLFVYDPAAKTVKAHKLLEMVESQNINWNQIDEYLSQVVANRFSSSEFMLRRIQEEIKKHADKRKQDPAVKGEWRYAS